MSVESMLDQNFKKGKKLSFTSHFRAISVSLFCVAIIHHLYLSSSDSTFYPNRCSPLRQEGDSLLLGMDEQPSGRTCRRPCSFLSFW